MPNPRKPKTLSPPAIPPLSSDQLYRLFVLWRARPMAAEGPQSPQDFALKYNLTNQDLINFTERESFQDDLLLESLNWAKSKTPELLHIVYREVKANKSVQDLERFVTLTHDLKKKAITNNQQFNFFTNLPQNVYESIVRREVKFLEDGSTESPA